MESRQIRVLTAKLLAVRNVASSLRKPNLLGTRFWNVSVNLLQRRRWDNAVADFDIRFILPQPIPVVFWSDAERWRADCSRRQRGLSPAGPGASATPCRGAASTAARVFAGATPAGAAPPHGPPAN